jgi:hypothetical protein
MPVFACVMAKSLKETTYIPLRKQDLLALLVGMWSPESFPVSKSDMPLTPLPTSGILFRKSPTVVRNSIQWC